MAQYTDITTTAKQIGLSVTSLRRGARSGRFPHIRQNNNPRGKILFDLQALTLVLASEAQASVNTCDDDAKKANLG